MTAAPKYAEIDARMTAQRREAKHLITPDQARALTRELDRQLEAHRHRGEGANTLPDAHHFVTTIYFDTKDRAIYRGGGKLKLRAKEYYDIHPGLTETATDPRQLVRYQPVLWLELKHKDGDTTSKQRHPIPKIDVPAFFAKREFPPEMRKLQDSCGSPLRADCLVNYRRSAWQDPEGSLRVTIDTGLAFFAPPVDLWARSWALVRQTLGQPVAVEQRRVLEIKSLGERPAWLVAALEELHIQSIAFSKFEAASSAVHG